MKSRALEKWNNERAKSLDEIEQAHSAVGGLKRGRRFATQQINQAYVVLLSSQFQGFCRDLHTECIDHLVASIKPIICQVLVRRNLERKRKLNSGNANHENIKEDFNRFGIQFWTEIQNHDLRSDIRKDRLKIMNKWRNAIAHQDFPFSQFENQPMLKIADVRKWRKSCNGLSKSFNSVMKDYLLSLTGTKPW